MVGRLDCSKRTAQVTARIAFRSPRANCVAQDETRNREASMRGLVSALGLHRAQSSQQVAGLKNAHAMITDLRIEVVRETGAILLDGARGERLLAGQPLFCDRPESVAFRVALGLTLGARIDAVAQ